MDDNDRYLTRDEAAALLGVPPVAVPALQLRGAFGVYVVNGLFYRYKQSEVLAYKGTLPEKTKRSTIGETKWTKRKTNS